MGERLHGEHKVRWVTLMGSCRVVLSSSRCLSFSASRAMCSRSCAFICAAVLASKSSFAARNFSLLSPSQREALKREKACGWIHIGADRYEMHGSFEQEVGVERVVVADGECYLRHLRAACTGF